MAKPANRLSGNPLNAAPNRFDPATVDIHSGGFFVAIFATHKRRATLKRISKKLELPKGTEEARTAAGSPSAVVQLARQELFVSSFNKEDERSELHVDGVQQSHTLSSLCVSAGEKDSNRAQKALAPWLGVHRKVQCFGPARLTRGGMFPPFHTGAASG